MDFQQKNVTTNDYKMSFNSNAESYTAQQFRAQVKHDNQEKTDVLKDRLQQFLSVATKDEAKELAKKILPTNSEISTFWAGDAKCIVVNKEDLFRITVISEKEVLSYNFE